MIAGVLTVKKNLVRAMARLGWKEIYAMGGQIMANYRAKGFKKFIREDVLQSHGSPENKAKSIALGTFLAFSPFIGFQTILAITLSVAFRLNRVLAFVFCHLTLPPLIPFLMVGQLYLGGWLIGEPADISFDGFSMDLVKAHLIEYLVGSLLSSVLFSALFGLSFLKFLQKRAVTRERFS